jgi:hypothetical protein
MVLYDVTFIVTATTKFEVFDFFKKFYKVHSVEILSQDPHQEK